jgi:6-phosphofructo-2-kinase
VGAKLIIVMVGLPARGKSYIVKKIARYLNWLQHPTRIFNVGDRRRIAAGAGQSHPVTKHMDHALRESIRKMSVNANGRLNMLPPSALSGSVLVNGEPEEAPGSPEVERKKNDHTRSESDALELPGPAFMEQDAAFFDPENSKASQLREEVAMETLDELLKYVLEEGGSVGIHDATNTTRERRIHLMKRIRERDPDINVLFLESRAQDKNLLESNMRLKLSGPDYKDKDPEWALKDFKQRVEKYERKYVELGDYEEENSMPYCSMVDVGRKMVTHQVHGFLSIQAVTYLMNFNLAPRQIWLTRHGESMDNVNGKIGGDSDLSATGQKYAQALEKFIGQERVLWEQRQNEKRETTHFPPRPGDTTPPNPEYTGQTGAPEARNFCVWTSMLRRSIQTGAHFSEDEYDLKQMRMLDELNAGYMEGMTYEQIKEKYPQEFDLRVQDKLHYRYPGPGGEGYLDIINRISKVILEVERMTDHVLIIGHRSITRVLLAYFQGLKQEEISGLCVPLGVAYMLEPVSLISVLLLCNADHLPRNRMESTSRRIAIIRKPTTSTTNHNTNSGEPLIPSPHELDPHSTYHYTTPISIHRC